MAIGAAVASVGIALVAAIVSLLLYTALITLATMGMDGPWTMQVYCPGRWTITQAPAVFRLCLAVAFGWVAWRHRPWQFATYAAALAAGTAIINASVSSPVMGTQILGWAGGLALTTIGALRLKAFLARHPRL